MTAAPPEMEAYRLSADAVVAALGSDSRRGLAGTEAAARLIGYGRNEMAAARRVPAWRKFLAQFQSVLVILLLVATVISAVLWFYERETSLPYEAMAILGIVLLNAVMGYVQEARAENAVAALRRMAAAEAHVIRDGERRKIPVAELVPGDLILIEEGDTIPADGRILHSVLLQTAEAALTGESLPSAKDSAEVDEAAAIGDRRNMVFSGTAATYGRATAVVVGTGMRTEMGRIAAMLSEAPSETTPLQRELDRVGRTLGIVVVAIAVAMIAVIVVAEGVHDLSAFFDALVLGVALAVAAVPEGLPTAVTVVLAIGVQRMARRNVIVRHLAAVETLGSANVIASDKTGTLTRNEMTVRTLVTASGAVVFSGTGYAPTGELTREAGGAIDGALRLEVDRALAIADRANNASLQSRDGRWTIAGDPTEAALVVAARKAGLAGADLEARFARVAELPFSSERKLMSTVHRDEHSADGIVLFTKGAPDVLLARCVRELAGDETRLLSKARRAEILAATDALAGRALRTLAVGFRVLPPGGSGNFGEELEHDLVLAGVIGMIDPPRDEARDAVARAKRAGIRPIMITGDHPTTASVIARELGIAGAGEAVTGAAIEAMDDATLDRVVRDATVYARVHPEHKLRIVKALQRGGAVVAMTGDGVNDAPALKAADIGVAMGLSGTDVSRQAADMILADDNFASIVAAIEEGRTIFANIRKFLRYLLSSNIGEVMTMFLGVLLAEVIGLRAEGTAIVLPLLATQLLWINLVTDGAPALALGLDPLDGSLMSAAPRPKRQGVITPGMWIGIFLIGAIMAAGTLFVLDAALPGGVIEGDGTMRHAQSLAFNTLVLFQLFNLFNARSDRDSAFRDMFRNRWLWIAVALSLSLQAVVLYVPFLQAAFSTTPLSLGEWAYCLAIASSVLWLAELGKLVLRRTERRRRKARAQHGYA